MLRVREPVSLWHPEQNCPVVPTRDDRYDADDPLVVAYPWAFADEHEPPIERATRASGEKRATRRSQ